MTEQVSGKLPVERPAQDPDHVAETVRLAAVAADVYGQMSDVRRSLEAALVRISEIANRLTEELGEPQEVDSDGDGTTAG